tara:strand:+ start:1047 stop:1568 length:522 start_codon:yes stop_codon:yes gene_type:complete
MADVLSDLVTNEVAVPVVRDDANQIGGYLKSSSALCTVSATIADTENVIAVPVPITARVHSVKLSAADATTALAANVGIFTSDGDGTFTVKDADFFGSAVDFSGGPFINLEVVNESAINTATLQCQPLWEALGYASEQAARLVTGGYFYVALDITTTGNGGPTTIAVKVDYVD